MSDYIDRQVALDVLIEQIALCDKALKSFGISMKDEYAVKVERASLIAYKEQLEAIPTADVAPVVHARWMPQKGGGLCCSECGGYALDEPDGNFIHVSVPSKFCPNCGAKMDAQGEE